MHIIRTVPSFHYLDADEGLPFFVNYLGFRIVHQEAGLRVVERGDVRFHLETNREYASQLPPLVRVETDDIRELWAELSTNPQHHEHLHQRFRNGPELRPWNAWEFAVKDSQACIVFQQWNPRSATDGKAEDFQS